MPLANEAPIVVSADVSGFDAAMREISQSAERFGDVFASTMRRAVISGRDLDDTLRDIALRFADLALGQALAPIENALSALVAGAFSGLAQAASGADTAAAALPSIVFNVTSPDVSGFAKSQNQISALLARAVSRGQRSL